MRGQYALDTKQIHEVKSPVLKIQNAIPIHHSDQVKWIWQVIDLCTCMHHTQNKITSTKSQINATTTSMRIQSYIISQQVKEDISYHRHVSYEFAHNGNPHRSQVTG